MTPVDTAQFKIITQEMEKDNEFEEGRDTVYLGLLKFIAQQLPENTSPKNFMNIYKDSFDMVADIEGLSDTQRNKLHMRMLLFVGDVFSHEFSEKVSDTFKSFLN
ncbi:MAG: hypothetical protein R3251_00860 [Candidatus Spechtbacterales bacterium]|nr:hypothetical protein [Candidatus Spechtbacterales bacterium]